MHNNAHDAQSVHNDAQSVHNNAQSVHNNAHDAQSVHKDAQSVHNDAHDAHSVHNDRKDCNDCKAWRTANDLPLILWIWDRCCDLKRSPKIP